MRVWIAGNGSRLVRLEAACRDAGLAARGIATRRVPTLDDRAARLLVDLRWRLYPNPRAADAWIGVGLGFARSTRIGACCPATAEVLEDAGARVSVVADRPHGRALALAVLRHAAAPARGETVGVLLGQRRVTPLVATLEPAGRRTRCAAVTSGWRADRPALAEADVLVLSYPASVADVPEDLGTALPIVALGPATVAALARRGWPALQAVTPTPEGVVTALERLRAIGARRVPTA